MASKNMPPKGPAPKGAPLSSAQKAAVSAAAKAGNSVIPAMPKGTPEFKRRPPMTSAQKAAVSAAAKAGRPIGAAMPKAAKMAVPPVSTSKNPAPAKMTRAGQPDKRVVPNKEKATVRQGTSVGKKSYAAEPYKRGNIGKMDMPKVMKAPAGARPPIPQPTVKDKATGMRRPDERSTPGRKAQLRAAGKEAYASAKAAREAAMRKAALKAGVKTVARRAFLPLAVAGAVGEVANLVRQDRENVKATLEKRRKANMEAQRQAAMPKPAPKRNALQKSQDKFMQDYAAKAKGGKAISGAESIAMSQIARAQGSSKFVGPKIVGSRKKK